MKKFASGPFFKKMKCYIDIQKHIIETLKNEKSKVLSTTLAIWTELFFFFPPPFELHVWLLYWEKLCELFALFWIGTLWPLVFFLLPSISKKNLPPYLFPPLSKITWKKSTQTIFVMTKVYFCNRYFLPNRRLQKNQKSTKRKYQKRS